jgi:hypothetical protein
MTNLSRRLNSGMLLASLLAGSIFSPVLAHSGQEQATSLTATTAPTKRSASVSESADTFYRSVWGVQVLGVRRVEAGSMIRFNYRVLDEKKSTVLNDKRWKPYLADETTGARLKVPVMDMIGELRQTSAPEKGRLYWMIFENPGGLVQAGSRVNVVIGSFRAEGLVVE